MHVRSQLAPGFTAATSISTRGSEEEGGIHRRKSRLERKRYSWTGSGVGRKGWRERAVYQRLTGRSIREWFSWTVPERAYMYIYIYIYTHKHIYIYIYSRVATPGMVDRWKSKQSLSRRRYLEVKGEPRRRWWRLAVSSNRTGTFGMPYDPF